MSLQDFLGIPAHEIAALRKEMAIEIASTMPDEWADAVPRIYASDSGHMSARDVGIALVSCLARCDEFTGTGNVPFVEGLVLATLSVAAPLKMPSYHLHPALAPALAATRPPEGIASSDLDWPFDSVGFYLPTGTIRTPDGKDIGWLAITRVCHSTFSYRGRQPVRMDYSGLIVVALERDVPGAAYGHGIGDEELRVGKGSPMIQNDILYCREGEMPILVDQSDESSQDSFGIVYTGLAISLLALLGASPGIISEGSRKRPSRGLLSPELWSPRVLGSKYLRKTSQGSGDSGSEVRPHWRRGHWRQQRHGSGLSQRRLIWIEPVFVKGCQA